jgi:hypothetical protein
MTDQRNEAQLESVMQGKNGKKKRKKKRKEKKKKGKKNRMKPLYHP